MPLLVVECGRMHGSTLRTSLLTVALVAMSGCTGTDIELTESATAPLNMTSSQPYNAAAATAKVPLIDTEAPADHQPATFALG
jgi:hypothetical protein